MKWWIVGIVVFLVLTVLGGWGFYTTGGRGLVRVVQHYLLKDIPDKKYTGSDFIPNNDTNRVSGFYSTTFSDDTSIAIWTLAGLRRYHHLSGKSIYYHRDVCAIVQEIKDRQGEVIPATQPEARAYSHDAILNITQWQNMMKSEYFVTVQWIVEDDKRVVDNLWSVSGRYRVIGRVGDDVCE